MSDRVVVLAGGKGTRLHPYTVVFPKPLMPLGEYPILEVIVRQLAINGFRHITLAVNHQANLIKAFFGDGEKWNVRIDYSLESRPLSTIAPLCLIEDLPETFLLMNGDILTDLPSAISTRSIPRARASSRWRRRSGPTPSTTASFGRTRRIRSSVSKRSGDAVSRQHGRLCRPAVGADAGAARPAAGFDDLMHALIARGDRINVRPHNGYWLDLGRPDDYAQAVEEFERRKDALLPG
jgi:NDP-sugar pyrophosphorylase family protein